MKIQNFKHALLVCSAMGAMSETSWASVAVWDITGSTSGVKTLLNPAIILNTAATTTTLGALTGTAYTTAALAPAASVIFNTVSCLGVTAATPIELDIIKPQRVTLDTAVATIWAPIKNPAGAPIAIINAANTAGGVLLNGAVASVLPDSLTATATPTVGYGAVYSQYCPATGNGSTFYPSGLIDAQKSMLLDLSGLGAANTSFGTSLGLVVPTGQILTIKLPTYDSAAAAGSMGSTTFPINFTGFLSGAGSVVIDSGGTGAGILAFTGDTSLWGGTLALANASVITNHTSLVLPALNFTANVYSSALAIPANTTQPVAMSATNLSMTGAISGAGNLLVSSTAAQRTLRLTADNSSWTGGLQLGDGTTTSAYGPKIQVDNATGLGASAATGGITLSFGGSQAASPILAFNTNVTTARTISVVGTNTTDNALSIDTYSGYTTNLNGIISGTSANGDALRLIGAGTTNLNAANTHASAGSAYFSTYTTGGGTVGMGTATSLGYNVTANLTNVLLDDGIQLTVPSTSATVSNALTLNQGTITVTAPATGATSTFSGVMSGTGGLTRGAGLGGWNFTAANTFTGGFNVPAGLTGITALLPVVLGVGVTSVGGTSGAFGNGAVNMAGLGTSIAFGGAYSLNTALITAAGPLTINDGGYAAVIPANIAGAGTITKSLTAGSLELDPVSGNTFTNPLVNLGGQVIMGSTGVGSVFGSTNKITLSGATSSVVLPNGSVIANPGATALTVTAVR